MYSVQLLQTRFRLTIYSMLVSFAVAGVWLGAGLRAWADTGPRLQEDQDLSPGRSAADDLASMGAGAKVAVPLLIEILTEDRGMSSMSSRSRLSDAASRALIRLGPVAADDLVKALDQGDVIARVLERIGPECVPSLLQGLKSKSPRVRQVAALLLVHLGPEAQKAVPLLLDEKQGLKKPN
jgi:HEAT repeat protein